MTLRYVPPLDLWFVYLHDSQVTGARACVRCISNGLACWPPKTRDQPARVTRQQAKHQGKPRANIHPCLNCYVKKVDCHAQDSEYTSRLLSVIISNRVSATRVVTPDDHRPGLSQHWLAKAMLARPGTVEQRLWAAETRLDTQASEIARWGVIGPRHLAFEMVMESVLQRLAYLEGVVVKGPLPPSYESYHDWGIFGRSSPSDMEQLGINMRSPDASLTSLLADYAHAHPSQPVEVPDFIRRYLKVADDGSGESVGGASSRG